MTLQAPPFNDPSIRAVLPWMGHLVDGVLAVHDRIGFRDLTSWYRNAADNQAVGGAVASQHRIGLAVDLTPATVAGEIALREAGFIVVNEFDHLHVQIWPAGVLAQLVDLGFPLPG